MYFQSKNIPDMLTVVLTVKVGKKTRYNWLLKHRGLNLKAVS